MNKNKLVGSILVIALLVVASGAVIASAFAAHPDPDARAPKSKLAAQALAVNRPIIVDHTSVDIHAIPQHWIEKAKDTLHIAYGHTSHGSQLTSGMSGLVGFANGGGLGLALPNDIFAWNNGGTDGALDLHDGAMGGDVGYYPQWVDNTRAYLGDPDPDTGRGTTHPDTNVIIWSWCGQVSGHDEESMVEEYLAPMTQLEQDYPGVTFVYMTGHANGGGEEGNVHIRNQQIREYCITNDKVLYDFYDIELYDPDGNYYGDRYVLDTCYYDGNGDGNPWNDDTNWALDWQGSHTQDVDWYDCGCAHSEALNCNQKAYAAWWLWARLAGWSGGGALKTASTELAVYGDTITYTIVVRDTGAPLTATVYLTDDVPAGLSYVPDTLTTTAGAVNDDDAPTLRWSGVLTPTPAVTVTYAVTVSAAARQTITNTAVIAAPGYAPITRTAAVVVSLPSDWPDLFPSYKTASPRYAGFGERVAYTVVISNATGPLSATVQFTDTLPAGMVYVPGTLTATTGAVVDAFAPTLTWSGVLSPSPVITITYAVAVTYTIPGSTAILPQVITNTATIAAPGYPTITRTAVVRTNWYNVYLPLVLRQ